MTPFSYSRPTSVADAVAALAEPGARLMGGGTNFVDLMRKGVEAPDHVVDVHGLPLGTIGEASGGGLRIGALVSNTALASDERVRRDYRMLSEALLSGATQQLRNRATTAGNVLQRTRCTYFMEPEYPCNKREPGSGCPAKTGFNRIHAILGESEHCIATHPSDMCVAMAALDATVHVTGSQGDREIPFVDFHLLPGDSPEAETVLRADDVITAITLPEASGASRNSVYVKVRDRQSYAFALVSVAAGIELDASGQIADVRIALGGVAHKPWRASGAEGLLRGSAPTEDAFREAGEAIVADANGYGHNDFKITLAPRTVALALNKALGLAQRATGDAR
ncbi:FAD binding domain-containing protein [Rubricoccus marinus]|uniref:FAD-binding molybdopterin dehydrogenase n=1 Tax=Rubricoccus marinus TaxID=716817 RepID=A0A259TWK4_9BACT|nr:xanthine dehydrogenase family protein subunit M [Rubricoccus marinus]OZC02076.1 FAD-binding molybdopterin dehydrogenase [Rubricoccus marinus]